MASSFRFKEINALSEAYPRIVNRSAAVALAFIKDRFAQQNWIGYGTQPWKPSRKSRGNTLMERGTLKRSIRIAHKSVHRIVIATDSKYARLHNEGGSIKITPKMRGYFFYKAKQIEEGIRLL